MAAFNATVRMRTADMFSHQVYRHMEYDFDLNCAAMIQPWCWLSAISLKLISFDILKVHLFRKKLTNY
jgi:hypothetical protein